MYGVVCSDLKFKENPRDQRLLQSTTSMLRKGIPERFNIGLMDWVMENFLEHELVSRWDLEWLKYFKEHDMSQYMVEQSALTLISDISNKSAEEVYNTVLCSAEGLEIVPLRLWCLGGNLVGKDVLEYGSGTGYLGKQLGLISNSYLGVDISRLATAIARGTTSLPNTSFVHLQSLQHSANLDNYFDVFDTIVSREFYIHQNFETALSALIFCSNFLKPKIGRLFADFFLPNPKIPQGVTYIAKSPLDPENPSCGFYYRESEIEELAKACSMRVTSISDRLELQRRFVEFQSL